LANWNRCSVRQGQDAFERTHDVDGPQPFFVLARQRILVDRPGDDLVRSGKFLRIGIELLEASDFPGRG
jgi:hypothetical protein